MSCLIRRILTFTEAFNTSPVRIMDLEGNDVTRTCLYSWSVDGVCYTNWATYDSYLQLTQHVGSDFYLRVLIVGSIGKVYINELLTTCYTTCIESSLGKCVCDDPGLFNPYANLDCALLLQQQLADTVVCMLGIPCYYFRCDPDRSATDFSFKEFVMHNVVDCKQIKVMIEDGQMPSSNTHLTELDFDWEPDWQVEVSKNQFASAFGDTVFPKERDFIYIPLMKRMWEVNSAYDEKSEGLMWRSTTWKLSLIKYTDKTNVLTTGFDAVIDGFIDKMYNDEFGLENIEQERETGYNQLEQPKYVASNLYDIFTSDAIRKSYTKQDIEIKNEILCHNHTIVSRNYYDFKNQNGTVIYQKGICGENGTISMIIRTSKPADTSIADFGEINFSLKDNKLVVGNLSSELESNQTYLVIYKWNRNTFTTELNIYRYKYPTNMPKYVIKPEQYYFDLDNPIAELVGMYNNDYITEKPKECSIHGHPLQITNIKLFNTYLSKEQAVTESLKYSTDNDTCVFADLARPIDAGRGYSVR